MPKAVAADTPKVALFDNSPFFKARTQHVAHLDLAGCLALGISGAPEHWEGMQGSQCIVAFNTDAKAPIFDGAHYGVVGDALEFLPLLADKIKARKG